MAKNAPRERRRREHRLTNKPIPEKFQPERKYPPIEAMNQNQADYLDSLDHAEQIFVLGPAGTGKTWLAATNAADKLRNRKIRKIILTRPNVPAGRSLGFFKGDLNEKFAPWAAPVIEAIKERIGRAAFDIAIKNDDIEMVPFEVMRGRSFHDAFVLLDEAQNATVEELKMFLTRIGGNCRTVVNGDISQCDLDEQSGLACALRMIDKQNLAVDVIEFTREDIVRSAVCAMWVRAFEESSVI